MNACRLTTASAACELERRRTDDAASWARHSVPVRPPLGPRLLARGTGPAPWSVATRTGLRFSSAYRCLLAGTIPGTALEEGDPMAVDEPRSRPDLASRVRDLMPQLTSELSELIAIPSVSEVGYPESTHEQLLRARDLIVTLLRDAGCESVTSLELPDTAPIMIGEVPAPDGAPTSALQPLRRWCPPATSRSGRHRRSSRHSRTVRSSVAAPATRSRTSSAVHRGFARVGGRPARRIEVRLRGPGGSRGGALTAYPVSAPICSPPMRW